MRTCVREAQLSSSPHTQQSLALPRGLTNDDNMLCLLSSCILRSILILHFILSCLLAAADGYLGEVVHAGQHLSNNAALHLPLRIFPLGSNCIDLICRAVLLWSSVGIFQIVACLSVDTWKQALFNTRKLVLQFECCI